jgi:mono/diheme cytochrome c family protein
VKRRIGVRLALVAGLAACGAPDGATTQGGERAEHAGSRDRPPAGGVATVPVAMDGSTVLELPDVADRPAWPLPAGSPDRFGLGTAAGPERIALWDRDVGPDGAGLPSGSGGVADGEQVWTAKCAACHGPTGREGPNDRLVGREPREGFPFGEDRLAGPRTVGNYWPYATTLFDYITRAMPQNAPGSLTADETYAVIAWILARNEIIADDAVMDASALVAVRMPAAGRFVPDNRRGGPEVR